MGKIDKSELPLSERLPQSIFNKIHIAIGMSNAAVLAKQSEIALNLCNFIADEMDKIKEPKTKK